MASTTILSDNGASSGSAGIKTTGGNDGVLILQTTTSGGTATNAVYIDTSQNVGVGTTSPFSKLDVRSTNAGAEVYGGIFANDSTSASSRVSLSFVTGSDGTAGRIRSQVVGDSDGSNNGYLAFYTRNGGTNSERARIDSSGNLGIGTTTPSTADGTGARFVVAGNAGGLQALFSDAVNYTLGIKRSGASGSVGMLYGTSGTALALGANNTEAARIDSSGNFLVACTAVSLDNGGFQVQRAGNGSGIPLVGVGAPSSSNANLTMAVYSTNLGQYQFYVGYGGTVYARSTSITGLSDQREKENIRALDVGLNEVLALQPRRFDWKDGSSSNVAGFVAQEVEFVLPDLVEEYKLDETETRFGLKMGDMIPVLVKAIQEQQALITSQSEIITQLQADVAALKGTQP